MQIKYLTQAHLTQQNEMRWACKCDAVDFVVSNPQCIVSAVDFVVSNPQCIVSVSSYSSYHDAEHAEQAAGFCNILMRGKFIVALVNLMST